MTGTKALYVKEKVELLKVFILAYISIFIVSCDIVGDQRGVKKENIVKIKTSYHAELEPGTKKLTFHITNRIVNRSICIIPYTAPDSSEYLFYLNGQGNDICIFSIDSARLIKIINLMPEGPNGVGSMVMGFEVINFDSIYVTSAFIRQLFLVNSDAKVISKINYSKFKQDYLIYAGVSRTLGNVRLGFKNNKIFMPFYPGYDKGNYKSIQPENIRFVAELDTLNKTARTLDIGFPSDYWESNYYPSFFSFFIHKDNFYVSYACDNRVLVSSNSKYWKTYIIHSKYTNVRRVIRQIRSWGINSNYTRFVPDPYRNVFYRFVLHEQDHIKDRTHQDLVRYPHKFSIIILDKDLNIIGETLFPIDKYDMHGYFINKDGLYLSLSNPFNPDYDIDKLEFQLINLV